MGVRRVCSAAGRREPVILANVELRAVAVPSHLMLSASRTVRESPKALNPQGLHFFGGADLERERLVQHRHWKLLPRLQAHVE
jgi:hypothetical protein